MKASSLLFALPLAVLVGCASPGRSPDFIDIAMFKSGAEHGLPVDQYLEGRAFQSQWRPAEANVWYRKAALQGQPDAMYWLGINYQNGTGIAKDTTEAYAWLSIGAASDQLAARNARQTLLSKMTQGEVEAGNRRAAELTAQIPHYDLRHVPSGSLTVKGRTQVEKEAVKIEKERAKEIAKITGVATTNTPAIKATGTVAPSANRQIQTEVDDVNPDRTTYGKDKPMRKSGSAAPKAAAKPTTPAAPAKPTAPVSTGSKTNSATELQPAK